MSTRNRPGKHHRQLGGPLRELGGHQREQRLQGLGKEPEAWEGHTNAQDVRTEILSSVLQDFVLFGAVAQNQCLEMMSISSLNQIGGKYIKIQTSSNYKMIW